jgi:predicted O-methyltransferase YrrM
VAEETWTAVDRYIADLLARPDAALEAVINESLAAGLPQINVTPTQGKLLYLLARLIRARRILEIGTLGGYSAIWLGRALPPDGRLVTLEIEPEHARIARTNISRAGLAGVVDVRVGRALDSLPRLEADWAGQFDLVFIDADKKSIPEYFAWSLKLGHAGTLIIVDNVVRGGSVIDPSSEDPDVRGVRRFNELLAAESRVVATEIQTVGSKGHDGFAFVLVL